MSLAPYSRGVAASAVASGPPASPAAGSTARISVLSLATGAVDSSFSMMAGRFLPWEIQEVTCQQAQTYGAGDLLTLWGAADRGPECAENGLSQRLTRAQLSATILPRSAPYPRIPGAWTRCRVPMAGRWPRLGRPKGTASWCLYRLQPLQAPTRPQADYQGIGAGLSVGIPRSAPVDTPAALAPTGRRGAQNLDAGDHAVSQFHPEFLQQAGTEEPQLGGPGC